MRLTHERPTLSLCMIVKNEEHYLPGCLDSMKDLVDEIVIVDTGSQDRTKEIAAHYGARVFDYTWDDNFSEARNESLRHGTGDWILYLDADERIDEENGRLLLKLICDPETVAYLVNVKSLLDETDPSKVHVGQYPRLFRNLPGLRFQGRIHEQIINSLKKVSGEIKETSFTILHLGYAKAQEVAQKYQRNLKLLQRQIMEEPNNAFAHYCLGSLYDLMGEADKAIECCQKSIELDHSFPKVHFLLANKLMEKGIFEQARKALELARNLAPNVPEIHYNLAVVSIKQKDYSAAANHFLDLIKIKPDYPNLKHKLAACYLKLGQWEMAAKSFSTG